MDATDRPRRLTKITIEVNGYLLATYVKCISGQTAVYLSRIEEALAVPDVEAREPVDSDAEAVESADDEPSGDE